MMSWASCGRMTVSPSGLFMSEAIFARNLVWLTPALAVRPVICRMSALIARALRVPEVGPSFGALTSR